MKHRYWIVVAAAVAGLLAGAQDARAQVTSAAGYTPPDDTPKVNVGGTIFADYTYQMDPLTTDSDGHTIHTSGFNLQRAYINVTGSISHWISFRITPDVVRVGPVTVGGANVNVPGLTGTLTYRLKYGYGQINFDDFATRGSWFRLGQQQTPVVDFLENVYRYRFQGTVFPDREGYLTSSDLGASVRYVLPNNYGEVHGGVYNGEGYTAPEANDQKAWQIRGTVRPAPGVNVLRGLRITGFYDRDRYVSHAKKNRALVDATFESPYLNAGGMYLWTEDQNASATKPEVDGEGYSLWANPKMPCHCDPNNPQDHAVGEGWEMLFRYDNLKPNKDQPGRKKRYIAGIAYWFPVFKSGIAAALLTDFEEVKYDGFLPGNSNRKPTERRIALHTLFNF
jgi:hypothetical protein